MGGAAFQGIHRGVRSKSGQNNRFDSGFLRSRLHSTQKPVVSLCMEKENTLAHIPISVIYPGKLGHVLASKKYSRRTLHEDSSEGGT